MKDRADTTMPTNDWSLVSEANRTFPSVLELADAFRNGRLSARSVTERALELVDESTFRFVSADRARKQAARADAAFRRGEVRTVLQGIPLGLKDLVDTKGIPTTVGSAALANSPPATVDSDIATILNDAGAVFIGKTTMTELAFSGLGLNQHSPIPENALDPERVPGGSSSGSAIAVAKGIVPAAIGSDTGGSVRIPAAFNGLVGLKPSERMLSMHGVANVSPTFDTLGPIARNTADTWALWSVLRGERDPSFQPRPVQGLRLAVPTTLFQNDLDPEVARGFERACKKVAQGGATVDRIPAPILEEIHETYLQAFTINIVEAYSAFEHVLRSRRDVIDPRVVRRLNAGAAARGVDLVRMYAHRNEIMRRFWKHFAEYDALLAPTVPILPPLRADLEAADEENFAQINAMVVRNTRIANYLGCPAATVPATGEGTPPFVGFMVIARPGQEHLTLSIAHTVETDTNTR